MSAANSPGQLAAHEEYEGAMMSCLLSFGNSRRHILLRGLRPVSACPRGAFAHKQALVGDNFSEKGRARERANPDLHDKPRAGD